MTSVGGVAAGVAIGLLAGLFGGLALDRFTSPNDVAAAVAPGAAGAGSGEVGRRASGVVPADAAIPISDPAPAQAAGRTASRTPGGSDALPATGPEPMAVPGAPEGMLAPDTGARLPDPSGRGVGAGGGGTAVAALGRPPRADVAPRPAPQIGRLPPEPGPAVASAAPTGPVQPLAQQARAALADSTPPVPPVPVSGPMGLGVFDAADAALWYAVEPVPRPATAARPARPDPMPVFAPSRSGRARMPRAEVPTGAATRPGAMDAAAPDDAVPAIDPSIRPSIAAAPQGPSAAQGAPFAPILAAAPAPEGPTARAERPLGLAAEIASGDAAPAPGEGAPPPTAALFPDPARPAAITVVGGDAEDRARLAAQGLSVVAPVDAPFPSTRREVRFFHAADAPLARQVADAYDADLRDFSSFRPAPPEGRIELRLPVR